MKKTAVFLFVLLCCASAFCLSFTYRDQIDEYDSFPMLDAYYREDSNPFSASYWDNVKIEVVTISRGTPIYSWFGHSGVLVSFPDSEPIMYDWGTFAFDKGFFGKFLLGRLWYCCSRTYGDLRIKDMQKENRVFSAVELDLNISQKFATFRFLETNATPGYNTYLYKFFTDNCATRIRDLVSKITNGDFEDWAKAREGRTTRDHLRRVMSTDSFAFWAFEFLASGIEDRPNTYWDEMFLPQNLEDYLLEYGKIGTKHTYYTDFDFDNTRKPTPEDPQSNLLFCIVVSFVISAAAYIGKKKSPKIAKIEGFSVNLVFGLMGFILFFMSAFTMHDAVYMNENVLYVNPILLVLAVLALTEKKGNVSVWLYRILVGIVAALVVLKICMPAVFLQKNWNQIITVLPYYIIKGFVKKSQDC